MKHAGASLENGAAGPGRPTSNPADVEGQDAKDAYPDGGREAWTTILGCWCGMLAPMGWLNALAVLQAHVSQKQLSSLPESTTGWIFSTYAFLMFSCGVKVGALCVPSPLTPRPSPLAPCPLSTECVQSPDYAGPMFDAYNVKLLIVPGSMGMVVMTMLLSVCKEFYQFFLTFSLLGGLSSSLLFTPCIATTGQWFSKRRALATGVVCTAGGTGGIVFPLTILYAEPCVGFDWSVRIIGLVCAVSSLLACLLVRKRLPHNRTAGAQMDFGALLDPRYALTTLAVVLAELAVFIPYTYISSYALHVGFEMQTALLMNSLLNVGAIPGRGLAGFVADRFGAFNSFLATTAACATIIFSLWYTAPGGRAAVISFTALFGFWSGATIALTPVCVSRVCRIEDYGKRSGTTYLIASIGVLVGAPVAGAMIKASGGSYGGIMVFSGAIYAASTATLYWARGVAAGWGPKVIF
ncbi:Major facilitator superfamily domain, general substrate transporter [Metarhizium album ARSEF 1941]|uniref:Major facilitator superfamily domain, general substrate transporter n=1 Tax=Metarhizium album (strain ARSEF 1941) TaxID=1081103 RepID=A0A0B2X3R9_METAS|nr:Major facilitator superfamily domain, general substrate transporter [Metarhizium album ARSEF 1941]KHO00388.1 Major facilitator superfamily domain, general substrate transporter [Metarhizium album ARSEF 1941]